MKRVCLLRSTDGNPDSRFQKYIWFLEQKKIPFLALCWDRNLKMSDIPSFEYFHKKANYGEGIRNLFNLFRFNIFLIRKLIKNNKSISVIHAADFDTIIPAIFMKLFWRKKVIYDIYDWYIDSRSIKNFIFKHFISFLELINIKSSDRVIICERERERQILFKPKHLWILPNIPNFEGNFECENNNEQLTVSYVGILGSERGLENLIQFAKENSGFTLKIAGFGPLSHLLTKDEYPNIHYYGAVSYQRALSIMSSSDIIYACYNTTNPNHILAAPNKYYEGLFLGKPIITTRGTIVGDKTLKYNTGFVIGETKSDLETLIGSITDKQIRACGYNAREIWDSKYSTYVTDFLNNIYLKYVKEC